jgi:putative hydrolase of the HAD superfamily
MSRAVVFDGDDTLWQTEQLYDDARSLARGIVEAIGLDGDKWEAVERGLDVRNVERFGHSPDRFPRSCVEAYISLCLAERRAPNQETVDAIRTAARTAFTREAPLVDQAQEIISELAQRGFRLALLTKGDTDVQMRRVAESGLAPFFDVIAVVDRKTPEVFRSVMARLGVAPSDTVTVGNSVRSDVLPSIAAGARPIWIDAHVWEYERLHEMMPTPGVIQLDNLAGLLDELASSVFERG